MTPAEFHDLDLLDAYFPVTFASGKQGVPLRCLCLECSRPLTDQDLRGTVTEGLADTFNVTCVGYCASCHEFTPMSYRLHPDGVFSGVVGGEWRRWTEGPSRPDAPDEPPTWQMAQLICWIFILCVQLWFLFGGVP